MATIVENKAGDRLRAFRFDGSSTCAGKISTWNDEGIPPKRGGISTRDLSARVSVDTWHGPQQLKLGDWIVDTNDRQCFAIYSQESFNSLYEIIQDD